MWQLPRIPTEDVLVYLRKSRTDDPTLTVSEVVAKHEQMLNEWVERNMPDCGGPIPEHNRFREIVSGETIDSRPAIKEVLRLAEDPKYKAILVVEPQRLSRGDLEDIGRLVKILRYSNTIVITLQYTYDLNDERDRDAFERELQRGNEFLEYQKRIMKNGRLLSVENGNFIGTTPPYGYRKIQIRDGKKNCPTLEPIPEEAQVVNMIFDMYLKGMGTVAIGDRLAELGIPAQNGGKWGRSTIANILDNIHYVGKVRWNYKKVIKTIKGGELVKHRPTAEDYLIFPGKHPAIVDEEKFNAVQKKRGSIPRKPRDLKLRNPLAGLMKCECGSTVCLYFPARKRSGSPRYACRMATRCHNGSTRMPEVMDGVKKVLEQRIENFKIEMQKANDDSLERINEDIKQLKIQLAAVEKREANQWKKYTLEAMPKHIFDQLNAEVLAAKNQIIENLCTLQNSIPEPVDYKERIATFQTAVDLIEDPNADIEKLNDILKDCIDVIIYSRPGRAKGQLFNKVEASLDVKVKVPQFWKA